MRPFTDPDSCRKSLPTRSEFDRMTRALYLAACEAIEVILNDPALGPDETMRRRATAIETLTAARALAELPYGEATVPFLSRPGQAHA